MVVDGVISVTMDEDEGVRDVVGTTTGEEVWAVSGAG